MATRKKNSRATNQKHDNTNRRIKTNIGGNEKMKDEKDMLRGFGIKDEDIDRIERETEERMSNTNTEEETVKE